MRVIHTELVDHIHREFDAASPLGTWTVRLASFQLERFLVNKETGLTGFQRLRGRAYAGSLVLFGEQVLARIPEDTTGPTRRYSKWVPRWVIGTWLGKTDESDQHLIAVNQQVKPYRSIRRFMEGDKSQVGSERC